MIVERISNHTLSSNTYVLSSCYSKSVWLVDCGDIEPILSTITNEKTIRGVFITHGHFDHIYGLNDLLNHFPAIVIYCSEICKKELYDPKRNFSRYHESDFIFKGNNIHPLKNGEIVPLENDIFVETIATPGHNPGCLTFKIGSALFTGDSYIPGVKTVTKLPGGNKIQSQESLLTISNYILKYNLNVYAGHL